MQDNLDVVFKIVEIVAVLGGGVIFLVHTGSKLEKLMTSFENLSKVVAGVQDEIKKLNEVIKIQAVQDEKIANQQTQIGMLLKWYDELRRGQGLITGRSDLQGGI